MAEIVGWQIEGEFITNLARSWFWNDDKPYEKCEELLLNYLICDELTENERKGIAQQIIEGRKKLAGVNEFTLEDDNENIRPIYLKIDEQHRQIKILEIKDIMSSYMINYVDPYSVQKSIHLAREYNVWTYEHCVTYFWYDDHAFSIRTLAPFEPGDGMILEECDDTENGLWLYRHPEIVYEAITKLNNSILNDRAGFWQTVYDIITDGRPGFNSPFFKTRNERYLAARRIDALKESDSMKEKMDLPTQLTQSKLQPEIDNTLAVMDAWLTDHVKPEKDAPITDKLKYDTIQHISNVLHDGTRYVSSDLERMYCVVPDQYIKWEGLIAPNGDFYSCSFGGHNAKAYYIISAYPEKFPSINFEKDRLTMDSYNALDTLLAQGWCATRYAVPGGQAYINVPPNGRYTKAQSDAIWDAKVKHDVKYVDLSDIGF